MRGEGKFDERDVHFLLHVNLRALIRAGAASSFVCVYPLNRVSGQCYNTFDFPFKAHVW